jgi:hypothetical protein
MRRNHGPCFIVFARPKQRSLASESVVTVGQGWRAHARARGIVEGGEVKYYEKLAGKFLKSRMVRPAICAWYDDNANERLCVSWPYGLRGSRFK